ncbi:conserved exported hypothetical protein [Tenacibaculum litopenaei]|uniref:TonB-dependent receptor domain-containing protein n=1 Tax=Tenacibaculum litopenaei TaxID=396016 RepID=UPI00389339A8
MKNLIFTILLTLISTVLTAQNTYTGKVVDSEKIAVPFANVVAFTETADFIGGAVTDEVGEFRLSLAQKPAYIEVSFMGFQTQKVPVKAPDLGTVELKEDSSVLSEVVITQKKKTLVRRSDRLVFNVKESVAQDLGSAVEVLRVTPNLVIRDDKLSMLGKSFVRLMVNGKMLPLQGDELRGYLSAINSENIERIEVITIPPSEYEAEGNGGIVNIVLKKQRNDFWSAVARVSSTQRTLFSHARSLAFNYKQNKTYLSISASNGVYKKRNTFQNTNYFSDERWEGKGPLDYSNKYWNYRISLSQELTDAWELGIGYTGSNTDIEKINSNIDEVFDLNNQLKYALISRGNSAKDATTHAVNLNNTIALDTLGKKLSIDVDYFRSGSTQDGGNSGERQTAGVLQPTFANQTGVEYNFENWSGRVDLTLPLEAITLKTGGKLALSKTNNDFKFYNSFSGSPVLDPNQSNMFQYDENIYALYVSASKNITDKLSAKVGLRMESTETKAYSKSGNQTNTNDYTKLFPTVYLNYKLSEHNSIGLNVSRRIDRPQFESLDPFKIVVNPFKTVQGNPFLQPAFITNYEFNFNSKKNELKFYFKDIENDYEQLSEVNPTTKVVNYTYYNHLNIQSFGFRDTYVFDSWSWLTSYNTVDVGYSKIKSSIPQTIGQQEGANAFVQSQNFIKLAPKNKMSLGINYYYIFPSRQNVAEIEGYGPLDLSFRMKLMEGNLNLAVNFNDVLKTYRTRATTIYNNVRTRYDNYFDARSVSFSVRYTFGNNKIRTKRNRAGNKDIQNRAR